MSVRRDRAVLRWHDNSFFGDPVLFQLTSVFHAPLLPELAELGAYAAGGEAEDRARAIACHRPHLHLYDNDGEKCEAIDLHPAYHSLLTRARHAGIASSLYEGDAEEVSVRHQARALRLFLLSGVECAPLQELCLASAALGILHTDAELCAQWKPLLVNRTHDPLPRPYPQKQSASLSFALREPDRIGIMPAGEGRMSRAGLACTQAFSMYEAGKGSPAVVHINGRKLSVINPLADGFLLTALFGGEKCLFLVPRLLVDGSSNGISLSPTFDTPVEENFPCADLCFSASAGWRLGEIGTADTLLNFCDSAWQFDLQVMRAGVMRRALRLAVDRMRYRVATEELPKKEGDIQARMLADAALDCTAATLLVMRLARARDLAAQSPREAIMANLAQPVVSYWLGRIAVQIVDCTRLEDERLKQSRGNFQDRAWRTLNLEGCFATTPVRLLMDVLRTFHEQGSLIEGIINDLVADVDTVGNRSGEVLRAAIQMMHEDGSVVCLLAEQFAYVMAAASMQRLDMEIVTSAFVNSRLGGQWRSAYGTLSPRFNPTFILETLYPSL